MVGSDFHIEQAVKKAKSNKVGEYDHRLSVDQRITLFQAVFTGISPPFPRYIHDKIRKKNIRHRLSERGLVNWPTGKRTPEVTPQGKKVAMEILKEIDEEKNADVQSEVVSGLI